MMMILLPRNLIAILQDLFLDTFEREEIYMYGFGAQPIMQGFPISFGSCHKRKTLLFLHLCCSADSFLNPV